MTVIWGVSASPFQVDVITLTQLQPNPPPLEHNSTQSCTDHFLVCCANQSSQPRPLTGNEVSEKSPTVRKNVRYCLTFWHFNCQLSWLTDMSHTGHRKVKIILWRAWSDSLPLFWRQKLNAIYWKSIIHQGYYLWIYIFRITKPTIQ